MNRLYTLLSVSTLLIATFCGCNKSTEYEQEEPVIEIPIPSEGYIFFDIASLKTRGTDMTGKLESDFSVLGYRYPSNWSTTEPLASQNQRITYADNNGNTILNTENDKDNYMGVFYGTDGKTYKNATPTAQIIEYNEGIYSYAPLQSWQRRLKYAFFAWYPSHLVVNPDNDGDYNSGHFGNPFIKYELPTGEDREARKEMYDVVTACKIDYSKAIDGQTVSFDDMQHRLAALDIKANNFINIEALKDSYSDTFKDVSNDATVQVDVTNLSLKLSGIKTSAKIPLNTKDKTLKIESEGSATKTYEGFNGATNIPYYLDGGTIIAPTSLIGEDELLILIPQDEKITASIEITYKITCDKKDITFTYPTDPTESPLTIQIDRLESGFYHYILLNITKSGLFIEMNKNTSWDRAEDITHTFE